MRCWFVPKRSAAEMREAIKQGGKRLLEAVRPTGEALDEFQKPLGDVWVPILKPLQRYIEDQHGIEAEMAVINSRLASPSKGVRESAEAQAEASWVRHANEAVQEGAVKAERVQKEIPNTPAVALHKAYEYAKAASIARFQREGWESGLLGPAGGRNHSVLTHRQLEQGRGRFLGVLKGTEGRVSQTLSAYERPRQQGALEKAAGKVQDFKHAAVGLHMWTPLFHIDTILGRFLPTLISKRAVGGLAKSLFTKPQALPAQTLKALRELDRVRNDPAEVERMARLGLIQLGPHGYEKGILSQLENAIKDKGKIGEVGHHALAGYKNALQWGINNMGIIAFHIAKDDLMAHGLPEAAAEKAAAKRATIIVGTLPKDMMSRGWRRFSDWALFSSRYTTTTWLTLVRALSKDRQLASELKMMGFTPDVVEKTLKLHQRAFQGLLAKDMALYFGLSNIFNYVMTGLYDLPDGDGKKGPHFIWENPGATWYNTLANIKFVSGRDPATGEVQYAQMPFRGTRDLAMMALQLPAWLTGADPFDPGAFQVYANKASPLVALAATMYTGRDWRGKTLDMPTTGETAANLVGNMAEILQPLPVRQALVKGASYASDGYYTEAMIRPWVDMLAEASPGKLGAQTLGIQTSTSDPVAAQYYKRQEAWRNWMSDPGIKASLKAGDKPIVEAYFNAARNANVPYAEAANQLLRIQSGRVPKGLQAAEAAAGNQ